MNKLKISDSDKRLLLIFFAIVIVACSYFFIFNKGMSKAAKIEEQNIKEVVHYYAGQIMPEPWASWYKGY